MLEFMLWILTHSDDLSKLLCIEIRVSFMKPARELALTEGLMRAVLLLALNCV